MVLLPLCGLGTTGFWNLVRGLLPLLNCQDGNGWFLLPSLRQDMAQPTVSSAERTFVKPMFFSGKSAYGALLFSVRRWMHPLQVYPFADLQNWGPWKKGNSVDLKNSLTHLPQYHKTTFKMTDLPSWPLARAVFAQPSPWFSWRSVVSINFLVKPFSRVASEAAMQSRFMSSTNPGVWVYSTQPQQSQVAHRFNKIGHTIFIL